MRSIENIQNYFLDSKSFRDIESKVTSLFANLKKTEPELDIIYVAGIISSDGKDFIQRNRQILANNTEKVREATRETAFVFSAEDIFDDKVIAKLDPNEISNEENWYQFWRNVLRSGVTHIVLTPRWEESKGATDEFLTANSIGLPIYYFNGINSHEIAWLIKTSRNSG